MKNKFRFLLSEGLKKKFGTKAFKIVNILLAVIIIGVINIDSVIRFFGGDFDEPINIYIVDEVGISDELETIINTSYMDILKNYNSTIAKTDKSLDELKDFIKEEENGDIIIHTMNVDNPTYENVFNVELISYEGIDAILYANIVNAINTTKIGKAMSMADIDQELLNSIYKNVEISRIMLSDDAKENEEFMEIIGSIITAAFVVPFFLLITLIIQMIGAEINEEKTSRSMEVIISSVSPETHFMSKICSANIFAISQGALLLVYALIGGIIRANTSGIGDVMNTAMAESTESIGSINGYISMFVQSDVASKLLLGIPFFIILIVLSFLAYSLFIGILASVTTSMEDYNQIQTPVMIFLMAGYFLAIYASVFQGSSFIKFLSFIPFISGIVSPVLYTLGQITIWGLIISIVLLMIVCFLLYKYGMKVYKVGILNYSSANLWKKIFKALKS